MKSACDLINARIAWCQRQREQADTESEADGWRAEEHGLQDALLHKNYTDAYRLCTTKAFRRYVLGLREGRTILRVAQVDYIVSDIATGTPRPGEVRGLGVSTEERNNALSTRHQRSQR
jgi:hypothetical protein